MNAITYKQYGTTEVLEWTKAADPIAKIGHVIVEVKAAALNPIDCEIRKGKMRFIPGQRLPKIPGSDFAGIILEVGKGVKNFTIGDSVYGMSAPIIGGSYAEKMKIMASGIAKIPASLSFEEAAGIPLVAQTALQGMRDLGELKKRQKIFVHGGSGGVGTVAIQIAKYYDTEVHTSCSFRNIDLCENLGADKVVDYTKQDITKVEEAFDLFFDVFGNMPFKRVKHLLKPKGKHVSTIPSPINFINTFLTSFSLGKKTKIVMVKSKTKDLSTINKMIESGHLKPIIDQVYSLKEAKEAQDYLETRRAKGKIILKIN